MAGLGGTSRVLQGAVHVCQFRRSVDLAEKFFPPEQPQRGHGRLGRAKAAQDELDEGLELMEATFERMEAAWGENSRPLIGALKNLAEIYLENGDFAEAEARYLRHNELLAHYGMPDPTDGLSG